MIKHHIHCDYCEKEIDTNGLYVVTHDVPYEGSSTIEVNKYSGKPGNRIFYVNDAHYCDLDCFIRHMKDVLDGKRKQ